MVADTLSTLLAAGLALLLAWKVGPALGTWSGVHRLGRFIVGLLTELRMLPILVVLVPLADARFGAPSFVIMGLLGGASRAAAVARFVSKRQIGRSARPARSWGPSTLGRALRLSKTEGGAHAVLLLTVPEVALLEGLSHFFNQEGGRGLGARLADGQLTALFPLLGLTWASIALLERRAWSPRREAARTGSMQ